MNNYFVEEKDLIEGLQVMVSFNDKDYNDIAYIKNIYFNSGKNGETFVDVTLERFGPDETTQYCISELKNKEYVSKDYKDIYMSAKILREKLMNNGDFENANKILDIMNLPKYIKSKNI